jgi:hypothetical protein
VNRSDGGAAERSVSGSGEKREGRSHGRFHGDPVSIGTEPREGEAGHEPKDADGDADLDECGAAAHRVLLFWSGHDTTQVPTRFIAATRDPVFSRNAPPSLTSGRLRNVRGKPTSSRGTVTMLKRVALFLVVIAASGCLPATERDFQMAQTVTEMSDAVNEIRQLSL